MKTQKAITCLLIIMVLGMSLATVSLAAKDTWVKKSDMPTARYGCSASVVNNIICVIGGGYLGDKDGHADGKESPSRMYDRWEYLHHWRYAGGCRSGSHNSGGV